MTAAVPSGMNHPTDETLAAFTDATLSAAERQEVMKHLAECAECRDVIVMTTEIKAVDAPAENVKPFPWKRVAPLIAAAAAIAVLVAIPSLRERVFGGDPMRDAVNLATTVKERPSEARLSLELPHQPPRERTRGVAKVGSIETQIAAAEAMERAGKKPTVENLHAAGLTLMYAGKRQEAVAELERAVAAAPNPSTALLNDLSAAYLGNGDYPQALLNAERVWKIEQTPTAAWNRALALEWVGDRNVEAIAAWQKYLEIDPNSAWAVEARKRLRDLEERR